MIITPWIQNISKKNIINGTHLDPGSDSVLIQIADPPGDFPNPKFKFKEIYQFDFLDIEEEPSDSFLDKELFEEMKMFAINDQQAEHIAKILKNSLAKQQNIIVHCHAGICRSGAVVDAALKLGFNDTNTFRNPNFLVRNKILQYLNIPFNMEEKKNGLVKQIN